ncbi:MAG: STM4011 family radical SAM protein [Actinomycetota bacterium]|nr:STM4011 family radical SAM protein [Actinomycetota bacterium]
MKLTMLYRGPLASCDLDCGYCPFAKRRDSRATLSQDRTDLARFISWVSAQNRDQLSVLFTPWGEALVRSWYRQALVTLSQLPHLERVAVQTNLSTRTSFLFDANLDTVALWCTYHPSQVSRPRFLSRVSELRALGVRHSVGIVGFEEHWGEAVAVREALPATTYLWVNAAEGHVYDDAAIARWTEIDPLFGYSARPHSSLGRRCRTGSEVVSVRGDGGVTRCHFVPSPLGNLYDGSFRTSLADRPCPLTVCDCHIGYVHLEHLRLDRVFGSGLLERIPVAFDDRRPVLTVEARAASSQGDHVDGRPLR